MIHTGYWLLDRDQSEYIKVKNYNGNVNIKASPLLEDFFSFLCFFKKNLVTSNIILFYRTPVYHERNRIPLLG